MRQTSRCSVATAIALALAWTFAAAAPTAAATHRAREESPADQYLAAWKETSVDQGRFFSSLTPTPLLSVVTARAISLATAYTKFADTMARIHWDDETRDDARDLETYLRSLAQFLLTIKEQTPSTISAWDVHLSARDEAGHKPFDALRRALGPTADAVTPPGGVTLAPTPTTVPPTILPATPSQEAAFSCSGTAPDGVNITYGTNASSISGGVSVPWSATLTLPANVEDVGVSAQLLGPDADVTCTTTVTWTVNGVSQSVTQRGKASGDATTASAEVCADSAGGFETC